MLLTCPIIEYEPPFNWIGTCKTQKHYEYVISHFTYSNTDNGTSFDLSPLTRHTGNFLTENSDGQHFYINVCHRLVASSGSDASNCPRNSAGCMKMKDGK